MDDFSTWIGTAETSLDIVSPLPLKSLASLLDHGSPPWLPGELPPLAHWFYFLPQVRQSEIDTDGSPQAWWISSASAFAAAYVGWRADQPAGSRAYRLIY